MLQQTWQRRARAGIDKAWMRGPLALTLRKISGGIGRGGLSAAQAGVPISRACVHSVCVTPLPPRRAVPSSLTGRKADLQRLHPRTSEKTPARPADAETTRARPPQPHWCGESLALVSIFLSGRYLPNGSASLSAGLASGVAGAAGASFAGASVAGAAASGFSAGASGAGAAPSAGAFAAGAGAALSAAGFAAGGVANGSSPFAAGAG